MAPANPIYNEVITRVLPEAVSDSIVFDRPSFADTAGKLDTEAILSDFVVWWKENAEAMMHSHVCHEAAPQLVFMAWLPRVVNGGGFMDREYGIGRGRIDILICWSIPVQRLPANGSAKLLNWSSGSPETQTL